MTEPDVFHVGIKAIITNSEGRILLLSSEGPGNTVRWDFPGGRIDPDEQIIDALKRELVEEINFTYSGTPEFIAPCKSKHRPSDGKYGLVVLAYKVIMPDDHNIVLNDYETGYEWCQKADVVSRLLPKYESEFLNEVVSHG